MPFLPKRRGTDAKGSEKKTHDRLVKINIEDTVKRPFTYGTQQGSSMTGTLTIILAAVAVGFIGALALLQAYFIGQCFMAGQPQENGYVSDCL